MQSLLLILKSSMEQEQHSQFVWNLAQAAGAKGHPVVVHIFGDGIYNLVPNLHGVGPVDTVESLANENVRFMYCNFNVTQRGLEGQLVPGAKASNTSDASMEVLRNDRVVMFS